MRHEELLQGARQLRFDGFAVGGERGGVHEKRLSRSSGADWILAEALRQINEKAAGHEQYENAC